MKFVKAAQRPGFSLDEIGGLLMLDDRTHCDKARQLAEQKAAGVHAKLADLRRVESVLATLVRDCRASPRHRVLSLDLGVATGAAVPRWLDGRAAPCARSEGDL